MHKSTEPQPDARTVMTFSPPSKPVVSKVTTETLLLQPFSGTPQLCFENVSVGSEATRLLQVRNTSKMAQMVMIERIPLKKGFTVSPDLFNVPPGGCEVVTFVWKPSDQDSTCRVAVSVRTEGGFKGSVVLLGTVKTGPLLHKAGEKVRKKRQKPVGGILMQSQRSNLGSQVSSLQHSSKTVPTLPKAKRPNVTVPKQFPLSSAKDSDCFHMERQGSSAGPWKHLPPTSGTPNLPRRETFVHSAAVKAEVPLVTAAGSEEIVKEFEDSLNAGHPQNCDTTIRDSTFTPPSSPVKQANSTARDAGHPQNCGTTTRDSTFTPPSSPVKQANSTARDAQKNDTFESSSSPEFIARMNLFYEQILQRGSVDDLDPPSQLLQSPSYHEFRMRMEERFKGILPVSYPRPDHYRPGSVLPHCLKPDHYENVVVEQCLKPNDHHIKSARKVSNLSTPLRDIGNSLDVLDDSLRLKEDCCGHSLTEMIEAYGVDSGHLHIENFFPADVSSIHGSPVPPGLAFEE